MVRGRTRRHRQVPHLARGQVGHERPGHGRGTEGLVEPGARDHVAGAVPRGLQIVDLGAHQAVVGQAPRHAAVRAHEHPRAQRPVARVQLAPVGGIHHQLLEAALGVGGARNHGPGRPRVVAHEHVLGAEGVHPSVRGIDRDLHHRLEAVGARVQGKAGRGADPVLAAVVGAVHATAEGGGVHPTLMDGIHREGAGLSSPQVEGLERPFDGLGHGGEDEKNGDEEQSGAGDAHGTLRGARR